MKLLFSDQHILVAIKPSGILSQSDEKNSSHMLSLLQEEVGGDIFPVHRLDRETGGVMVFARSSAAAAKLSQSIQEQKFQKEYWAVLCSSPEEPKGSFADLLFFDRQKNKVYPVKRERKGVKKALLHYEIAETVNQTALAKVFPITGRTHQIRVQFASRSHPLYGDRKYGGLGEKLALFCHRLSFPHPKSGETLCFSALPPKETPWTLFSSIPFDKET